MAGAGTDVPRPARVAVTRAPGASADLVRRLAEGGAVVVELPAIEIAPLDDTRVLDGALAREEPWDLLVLTSPNGVAALSRRLAAVGRTPAALASVPLAVVGGATAAACRAAGLEPRYQPREFRAEALLAVLPDEAVVGRDVLVVRALDGRDVLPRGLEARGARVTLAPAYRTAAPAGAGALAERLLRDGLDVLTFASGSAVRNLDALLSGRLAELLGAARIVTIGPVTTEACREIGLPVHAEAARATLPDLAAAALAAALAAPKGPDR